MIIAIDFDGTCVTHNYPGIGENIGAEYVLKALTEEGHILVLNTMRSGKKLKDAENWFKEHKIPLYGINKTYGQENWTSSPKVYANLYIDDSALGCPLNSNRQFVDWIAISEFLVNNGILSSDKFEKIKPSILEEIKIANKTKWQTISN